MSGFLFGQWQGDASSTAVSPGKVHAPNNGDWTQWSSGGHRDIWVNKTVPSEYVNRECLVRGYLSMGDFSGSGAYVANIRGTTGFANGRATFSTNREWTGGSGWAGSNHRTGYIMFQLLDRLTSTDLSIQVRIDNSGNFRVWNRRDIQSNIVVFPVSYE